MLHNFYCEPTSKGVEPLSFTWDDETYEVSGVSAALMLAISTEDGLITHPYPTYYDFEGGAGDGKHIKHKSTIALIISQYHHIPAYFAGALPEPEQVVEEVPDVGYMGEDGVYVLGRSDGVLN